MNLKKIVRTTFYILLSFNCLGQINIVNGSFEGEQGWDKLGEGWDVCFDTPDTGPFGLSSDIEPSHGESYLVILAQDDENLTGAESVSQILSSKLQKDSCYSFEIDVASLENYFFAESGRLQIILGFPECDEVQIIFDENIMNPEFERIKLEFSPIDEFEMVLLKSSIREDGKLSTVVLDNMSNIEKCILSSNFDVQIFNEIITTSFHNNQITITDRNQLVIHAEVFSTSGLLLHSKVLENQKEKTIHLNISNQRILFLKLKTKSGNYLIRKLFIP